MEQIRDVAVAYYKRSSAEEKVKLQGLFKSLDVNGDGRVSPAEFKSVVGYSSGSDFDSFFNAVDQNGDGALDFEEILTLAYMVRISVRSCDGCSGLLTGSYFSCVLCEIKFPSTYDLCCACYGGGKFHHHHSAESFLDDRSMRMLLSLCLQQPAESKGKKEKTAIELITSGVKIGSNMVSIGSAVVQTGCIIM